MHGATVKKK